MQDFVDYQKMCKEKKGRKDDYSSDVNNIVIIDKEKTISVTIRKKKKKIMEKV